MAENIARASAEDTSGFGQAFAHLREGRGDVLDGVGQEEDDVGDDEDRHGVVQRQKGVDVIPKEHDADDKDDAGEHFLEKALRFKDLAALFMSSYSKHDECPQHWRRELRWQCQGRGCFRWRRGHHSPSR